VIHPREFWQILKEAFVEWDRDNVSRLAAALAYYAIFSLAPILVIAIGIAGFIFGHEAASGQIVRQIQGLIGREGAEVVQTMIEKAGRPSAGLLATALGIFTLLVGATGVFGQLQSGLNTVWSVAPKPGRVVKGMLRTRMLSFTLVLGIGFLLLISLVVSAATAALGDYLQAFVPGIPPGLPLINSVLSFVFVTVLFAMIYKILPDVEIPWRDVCLGSAVTSLLFTLGKHLIGLYLGNSSIGSTYGAAGTLAVLLIWIYYSAHIFYLGAEITQVYSRKYGTPIRPANYATPVMQVRVGYETPEKAEADLEKAAVRAERRLQRLDTTEMEEGEREEQAKREGEGKDGGEERRDAEDARDSEGRGDAQGGREGEEGREMEHREAGGGVAEDHAAVRAPHVGPEQ
jgi:membrane protein